AALIVASSLAAAAASDPPVVVELYTSEGCSSCPPADAYLGELAKQPGVVALAFHVDYWDYIGWKDPFAFPAATERQRRYTTTLGSRYLYTPEMVVDGARDATGSDRDTISKLIATQGKIVRKLPLAVSETSEDKYTVSLPASSFTGGATVWMMVYDREHSTPVVRGENEGRTLQEFNVVRTLRSIGRYDGKAQDIAVAMELTREQGCAILVQADHQAGDGQGPIMGAALVEEK
ncbi:MAG: DUF1223 domain-containing protein, partial [Alphaproteobacteria bacterium]